MKALALVLAFVPALAAVEPAQAATISALTDSTSLKFEAAPGERNDVSVTMSEHTYTVRDARAPLTAEGVCQALDVHTAECRTDVPLEVSLGDRDDRIRLAVSGAIDPTVRPGMTVHGGSGNDSITGGPSDDTLDGGPGADMLDGGPGTDSVDYSARTRRVVVRLGRRGPQGERGEGDRIARVEAVLGGSGPDLLVGDGGGNRLQGGLGRDVLRGGGGDDLLDDVGETSSTDGGVLDGGPGDDGISVDVALGGMDNAYRVRCGPGSDDVSLRPTLRDLFSDCETVFGHPALPRLFRSGGARYDWLCEGNLGAFRFTCSGSIAVRNAGGRLLGSGHATRRFPAAEHPGGMVHIPLRVTRLGRRMFMSPTRSAVRVHVRFRDSDHQRAESYSYRALIG